MNAPAEGARIEAELRALHDGAVPVKTARGREELGQRRGALRPRLRSLLLLADGRRSLANLRSMAVQTGGSPLDVDELLREGYIEITVPAGASRGVLPVLVHEAATVATAAAASMPTAPPTAPSPAAPQVRAGSPAHGVRVTNSSGPPASAALARATVAPPPMVEQRAPAVASVPPEQHMAPAPANQEPTHAPEARAPLPAAATPPISAASQDAKARGAVVAAESAGTADAAALNTARELLRDWLALDGPRGNGRLRSLQSRIEQAPDIDALVALLEEAESQIPPTRRSHQAQLRIAQLRDVLGLGNTRTAEDTQPGVSGDEAGAWAPTLPGK